MDLVLSILVGLAAGLAVALVTPAMGPPSRTDFARRRVRAMATGGVGAIAAGYGISLVESSLRAGGLTTTLASLAGALWLAGIVEVYSSRRRSGEGRHASTADATRSPTPIDMPAYDAARQVLVTGLIEDALAHEAGQYAKSGRGLPAIRDTLSREDPAWPLRLQHAVLLGRVDRGPRRSLERHWRSKAHHGSRLAALRADHCLRPRARP